MVSIAPSILSADFMNLGKEIRDAEKAGADMIHVDVMDGHFVPNLTIGHFIVKQIKSITELPLDVHLMIEKADRFFDDFIKAGASVLTVHFESERHLHRSIRYIKDKGVKAGVSINPATPVNALYSIIHEVDLVLLMSVNPGFGGQTFITHSLEKIAGLRTMIAERELNTLIEVDGGVKVNNAAKVHAAGADILVMGSAFFKSEDYKETVKEVRGSCEQKVG